MNRRALLAVVLVGAVGCGSADPQPVTPPEPQWALTDPGGAIAGETPLTRRISEAGLAFELPTSDWQLDHHQVVAGAEAALYRFHLQRVKAAIEFMLEHVGQSDDSAQGFAREKQKQLPPSHVDGTLGADVIGLPGAVGYQADRVESGVDHSLFVVYALHHEIGIVVIMDAPSAAFGAVEPAFRAALATLRYYR